MRCEDIPVRSQNTRKEVKNREIEEQIETDEKNLSAGRAIQNKVSRKCVVTARLGNPS